MSRKTTVFVHMGHAMITHYYLHGCEQATGCSLFDIQYTAKNIYLA